MTLWGRGLFEFSKRLMDFSKLKVKGLSLKSMDCKIYWMELKVKDTEKKGGKGGKK